MTATAPLWRDPLFARVWTSYSASELGSNLIITVVPLIAAVLLQATPWQMGVLTTASTLPYLLVGPLVGVFADRLPRRTILVVADLVRASVLALGVTAALGGLMSFALLYLMAFAIGIANVWYDVAYGSYLPFIVPDRSRLISANSYVSGSQAAATTVGPAIAGAVLQAFGAAASLFAGALLYLLSALLLFATAPGRSSDSAGGRSVWADLRQGVTFIWTHRLLRTLTTRHVIWHMMVGAIFAQVLLHLVSGLKLTPSQVGAVLSVMGAGTFTGVVLAARISRAFGVGGAIIRSNLLAAAAALLIALPLGAGVGAIAAAALAMFGYGFCVINYQINNASLRQTATPDVLLGRMTAVTRMTTYGANALGALTAGSLAERIGLQPTIGLFAAVAMLAAIRGALGTTLRSLRTLAQAEAI